MKELIYIGSILIMTILKVVVGITSDKEWAINFTKDKLGMSDAEIDSAYGDLIAESTFSKWFD